MHIRAVFLKKPQSHLFFQNPTITHKAVGSFLSWPKTRNVFGLVMLKARNAKSISGLWFLVWLLGDLGA